jgi:hypothetical protein
MAAALATGVGMTRPRSLLRSTWLLGPVAVVAVLSLAGPGAQGSTDPVPGSQGVDTALPATASQATVSGRGKFANLAITVNQTANLANQAVSITWSGGTPTRQGPGRFGANFLQIMQCWGDDDGTVPGNPGPPPEQCVQGAVAGTFGGLPDAPLPGGFASSRVISRSDWANFNSNVGFLDTRTTNVWRTFRSVTGKVVTVHTDPNFNPSVVGGSFWLNEFFNIVSTNEIAAAATGPDGKGAELFEVLTGVQSSGLGCGKKAQAVSGGDPKIPQCWIVVVPRGLPADENVGTPFAENADQNGVVTSPLSPTAWANRIAIPISFKPLDSPCQIGAEERRVVGSELILGAFSSWQPALCSGGNLPPYSYAPVSDSSARLQLAQSVAGGPGMVAVSRPLPASASIPENPVVYAPLAVSGIVIGFNIERNPKTDAPAAAQLLSGVRVADLNLTPRLVAKLLTQSYRAQINIASGQPNYQWPTGNPVHLGLDPDFVRFNPEFALLQIQDSRAFSGLQVSVGTSDAAQAVWEWILADPEAAAWLGGAADEWGMKVNPAYSTKAASNTNGVAFGDPVPNAFSKNEPYCYRAPPIGQSNPITPSPLCITDWMPASRSFADSARIGRVAFDGARIALNPFATAPSDAWRPDVPQYIGRRGMLVVTDTASAMRYGVQMARLSRSGDNGATRQFVAPNTAGLVAGVDAMAAKAEPSVLEPTQSSTSPSAYPLTSIVYAAIKPLSLDTTARSQYAALLDYAAGPGQVIGTDVGQLPTGFLPLPDALKSQTQAAANQVRTLTPPPPPAPPTTVAAVPTLPAPTAVSVFRPTTTRAPVTVAAPVVDTTVPVPETTTPPTTVAETTTTTVPATTTTTQPTLAQAGPVPETPRPVTAATEAPKARFVMAGMGIVSLASALLALEITKRARRASGSALQSLDTSDAR